VRVFGGHDPVTGKQVMLTGSAEDEDEAIKLRDKFRRQVAEATAARTSVTLGYLLDEWLAGHQVEGTTRTSYRVAIEKFLKPAIGDTSLTRLAQLGARPFEQLYAELRVCRRRQRLVADCGSGERLGFSQHAQRREHRYHVHVLVSIHPHDNLVGITAGLAEYRGLRHAGHGRLSPDRHGNRWPSPGRCGWSEL
jgi:hypothetical protein